MFSILKAPASKSRKVSWASRAMSQHRTEDRRRHFVAWFASSSLLPGALWGQMHLLSTMDQQTERALAPGASKGTSLQPATDEARPDPNKFSVIRAADTEGGRPRTIVVQTNHMRNVFGERRTTFTHPLSTAFFSSGSIPYVALRKTC